MKVKYKDNQWEFQSRTYEQLRKAVLISEPSLSDKNWIFAYRDAEGDEVLLESEEELSDTIEYYSSCQKTIILIVKEAWWKDKSMRKRSRKRISQISMHHQSSITSGSAPSSDSDQSNSSDDYLVHDVRPGQYFYEDIKKPGETKSSSDLESEQSARKGVEKLTILEQFQKQVSFLKSGKSQSSLPETPIKPIEFTT